MTKIAKPFIILLLSVLVAVMSSGEENRRLPTLRIGHAPHDHHAPLYIAALNPDYFKENGGVFLKEIEAFKAYELIADGVPLAHVSIDSGTGGKELVRKLTEHYFDMSFGGLPAMLQYIDKNDSIRILSPVMTEGAGLVVGNNLPVENWEDFKEYLAQHRRRPFRIGYKVDVSVQNLIFERALDAEGISFSKRLDDTEAGVILINLYGAKNLIPALKSGLIDGFVVMQPFLALAEYQGAGKGIASLSELPPKGKWKGHPCCAFAATQDYLEEHPIIAENMLRLMLRANAFINRFPKKSAAQVARWLGVPAEVEQKAIPTIKFIGERTRAWDHGVNEWVSSMILQGMLKGRVKQAYETGNLDREIYGMEMYQRARRGL
ncbi:MAG: ABC transporter substrate-binding protein [Desulfobacter sp.]|nr:MAG: ABC transporter substrate-binding protein [Desulfobacter sp.]